MSIRYLRLLVVLAAFGVRYCRAKTSGETWPFYITPDAQPRFTKVFANLSSPALPFLTVKHRLVFDGLRYQSSICIPEIESYVTKLDAGRIQWLTLSGDLLEAKCGKIFRYKGFSWIAEDISNERIKLRTSEFSVAIEYSNCRLESISADGSTCKFGYVGNQLVEIRQIAPAEKVVLSITVPERGELKFNTMSADYLLTYSEKHQLTRVSSGQILVTDFGYQTGLLTSISDASVGHHWFDWKLIQLNAKSGVPLPPFVQHDDDWDYERRIVDSGIEVHFKKRTGGRPRGYWRTSGAMEKVDFHITN